MLRIIKFKSITLYLCIIKRMSILDNLLPSQKNHSISRVVFSFFLAQKILQPEKFKDLLLGNVFNRFQKFQVTQEHGILFEQVITQGETTVSTNSIAPKTNGFIFQSFTQGEREYVLKLENRNSENPSNNLSVISVELYKYIDWNSFILDVKSFIIAISKFQANLFIKSFSLSYIDQFNYINTEPITMKDIFVENKFFPSIINNTPDEWAYNFAGKYIYEETELVQHINANFKRISDMNQLLTLAHTTAKPASNDIYEINEQNLNDIVLPYAERMHTLNKVFLKESLVQEVLDKIGI